MLGVLEYPHPYYANMSKASLEYQNLLIQTFLVYIVQNSYYFYLLQVIIYHYVTEIYFCCHC